MKRPQSQKKAPDTLLIAAIREGRPAFLFAGLFSLITNALYMALPIYTNQVYGRVLSSYSVPTLIVLTTGTIAVFAVSSILDNYRARVLSNFSTVLDQRVAGHAFTALFDGVIQRAPQAGAQALRDVDGFRQTLTGNGISILFDLPWVPLYIIVLFVIDPAVGAITLVGGCVLLIFALLQDRASRPALKAANEAALRSYAFTETGLRNSEAVRAMGMLPHIGREWGRHRLETMTQSDVASRSSEFWGNWIKFVRMLVQILIIGVGAYLIIKGDIGPGLLFANMILSSRALQPIERTVGSWPSLVAASQAYERLNVLLTDYQAAQPTTALPRPQGRLTVEGLNYAVPGTNQLILTGINFDLAPGTFLGLVGPSGAGKSTLARLLVGVTTPLNGSVRLDGSSVFGWSRTDFGQYVGYLPQDTELFAGTVRDNIARFQQDVSDEDVIAAARTAGVHDLIVRLAQGYDTELGTGGMVLSVGQRQRVGLARAVLKNPAFVVLDEPNANLDAQGEQALMEALVAMKARGVTVVVVSHKPSILNNADQLLVLRDGRISLYGKRDDVLAKLAAGAGAGAPVATPPAGSPGQAVAKPFIPPGMKVVEAKR
jgi:ATP-binding cassette subfamily C exporter for protease/lipase